MPCSSVKRKATFSRTVRESNNALSWKTIPTLPRRANSSCSCIFVTSSPRTRIRPESGLSNPSTSLRMVLFPEPATPNNAFVSPTASLKETPHNTSVSAKASHTSSKTTVSAECPRISAFVESSGMVGTDMRSLVGENVHQKLRGKEIHDNDQHRGCDYSLGCGSADSLCPSTGCDAVEAAHGCDDEAEQNGFHQAHEDVFKDQRLPCVVPVLPGIEV